MKTNDYKQERAIQLLFGEKFITRERTRSIFPVLERAEMRQ
jgi:hypothetical protein